VINNISHSISGSHLVVAADLWAGGQSDRLHRICGYRFGLVFR